MKNNTNPYEFAVIEDGGPGVKTMHEKLMGFTAAGMFVAFTMYLGGWMLGVGEIDGRTVFLSFSAFLFALFGFIQTHRLEEMKKDKGERR
jgi:hypothetical protein